MQETDIDFVHYIEILWQKEAQTENNNNYKQRGKESYTIKPQYIYKLLTYRHIVALSDTSKCATPGFVWLYKDFLWLQAVMVGFVSLWV